MLEKDVQRKIIQYARDLGCEAHKVESKSERGFPDVLILSPGGVITLLEVKSPTGRRSVHQVDLHLRFSALGTDVLVVNSLQAGKAAIDAVLANKL